MRYQVVTLMVPFDSDRPDSPPELWDWSLLAREEGVKVLSAGPVMEEDEYAIDRKVLDPVRAALFPEERKG